MTKQMSLDLLSLAEAVANGELRMGDAEVQVLTAMGPDHETAAEPDLRELRGLIVAASAVRGHARATREAFGAEGTDRTHADALIATLVTGPVRAGSARRHRTRGRAARGPRRTWLLVAATLAIGAGAVGVLVVGGRSVAPNTTSNPISSPTGEMTVGRGNHTATLIGDGRVLVVGGFGTGLVALDSAELYDPNRNTFSPTGSMTSARTNHPAIPLLDGRVLVVGGLGDRAVELSSAELYDPRTGSFSPTGGMTVARGSGYAATLLADGRVLVTGGKTATAVASAELYDPASGTFSPTGSMTDARSEHAAVLLADGRVLVTGGQSEPPTSEPTALASAELYDPISGTFGPTGPMETARAEHTVTLLADRRVLVTGGLQTLLVNKGLPIASAELYDPRTGTFNPTGSMAIPRVGYTATLLVDGQVLIAGGSDLTNTESASGEMLASAERYDPTTGTFSPTGSMATGRAGQTATTLADNRVLVTGGVATLGKSAPGPFLSSAELYDPKTGVFSSTGP